MDEDKRTNEELRQSILFIALNKKCNRIQEKIHQEFIGTLQKWEMVLFEYIRAATKLASLSELTAQQNGIDEVRNSLKDCTGAIQEATNQFDDMWQVLEKALTVATINDGWIEHVSAYEQHLSNIRNALEPMAMFAPDRLTTDTVSKMVHQIVDVQTKLNALSARIEEAGTERMRHSSARMNAYLDRKLREGDSVIDDE